MLEVKLPNVRNLFLPDPGYTLIDCDLSGADAQVVAWEANDEPLKQAFRDGLNVHNFNGETIWGAGYRPDGKRPGARFTMRDECKRGVHGTNYGAMPRTIAITLSWTIRAAEDFQRKWFTAHPGIRDWHERTDRAVQTTRTIRNAFGYRIVFFDRGDNLLPRALAWVPQSTVGIVAARGAVRLAKELPWLHVLLQVHDSVVFQIPNSKFESSSLARIKELLTIPVPYPDPLIIPWEMAYSRESWGKCKKANWDLSNAA